MSDSNKSTKIKAVIGIVAIVVIFGLSFMNGGTNGPMIGGIRSEFLLFALTLLGVALLHNNTFEVAIVGLVSVIIMKLFFVSDFHFIHHMNEEKKTLINLLGLLLGFAILAKHFETSHIPEKLPKYLPSGWVGGFILLVMVFVISSFLDNIAAAMIGGTVALSIFDKKVHIGYIAAIVAASNAGGSGSVVGDTTTTMMWIDGVNWHDVIHAYFAAVPSLIICGIIASIQQNKYHPLSKINHENLKIKWEKILIVVLILVGAILTNIKWEGLPEGWDGLPALGVWVAILIGAFITKTPWGEVPKSLKGTFFLLSLVLSASLMPVKELPGASEHTAFGLGFVSAVFDNIPLTKLALTQGGYDWGVLAYCVGFGGSMIWFGSSAGVAITNTFPEGKSVGAWLKSGWHVTLSYIVGFYIMIAIVGWNPHAPHKEAKHSNHEKIEASSDNKVDKMPVVTEPKKSEEGKSSTTETTPTSAEPSKP